MKKNVTLLILLPVIMAWQCSGPGADKLTQDFQQNPDPVAVELDPVKFESVDSLLQ